MTLSNKPKIDLQSIAGVMSHLTNLESNDLQQAKDEKFLEQTTLVGLGIFRLVVMGEIKKGKSSFINALCEVENLVPCAAEVATSTVFKIRYGKALRYTVFFQTEPQEATKKEVIDSSRIAEFGTETGNPGNIKKVDFISIEVPSPVLASGLIIVDTPGVGGVFKGHREITLRHAPRADAIFFITDCSESPLGKEEIDFLNDLKRITTKIFFIQTKSDLVEESEAQIRKKNNIAKLVGQLGLVEDEIVYFIVSSYLKAKALQTGNSKYCEYSGFPTLMNFYNDELKGSLDRSIAEVAVDRSQTKLQLLVPEIQWRRKIVDADNEEKRRVLNTELEDYRNTMKEWVDQKIPSFINNFNYGVTSSIDSVRNSIAAELSPNGSLSREAQAQLAQSDDVDYIYDSVDSLFSDSHYEATIILNRYLQDLEEDLRDQLCILEEQVSSGLADYARDDGAQQIVGRGRVELEFTGSAALDRLRKKPAKSSVLGRVGTYIRGTVTGGFVGKIAAGIAAFFTGGAAIPLICVTSGSFFGGAKALREQKRSEAEAARSHVKQALDQILASTYQQAAAELSKTSLHLQRQAAAAVTGIKTRINQTLESRAKSLSERKGATEVEIAEKARVQKNLEDKAGKIALALEHFAKLINESK